LSIEIRGWLDCRAIAAVVMGRYASVGSADFSYIFDPCAVFRVFAVQKSIQPKISKIPSFGIVVENQSEYG
jgi:hypothetical protein